jgi:hypothetical protein
MPDDQIFVVDRIEGGGRDRVAVLVGDDGRIVELAAPVLATNALQGAVLRVPLSVGGAPIWPSAIRDIAEEQRRRKEYELRTRRLSARDPGGDLKL